MGGHPRHLELGLRGAGRLPHELVDYWIEQYDWRAHEAAMNRWTHLRGDIDGVTLHVLHERGSGTAPVPLVLTHGWPWTFWDFAKVIEPLAHPERFGGDPEDGFDVVVPSLPGSVFSSPTPGGIGWRQTASLWVRLMDELGYERFGAHGGDSGAFVSAQLAHAHADRLIGAHLSYPSLLDPSAVFSRDDFDADEVEDFDRQRDPTSNMTHFLVHMLEPQTLAWALQDSPVGLASWMLHRRAAWSDCDGDVERRFTKDELITSFALYWLTGTVSSSLQFYADSFRQPWQPSHDRQPTLQAPTGIAVSRASCPTSHGRLPSACEPDPLDPDADWRTLRPGGGTRTPGAGHPRILPASAIGMICCDQTEQQRYVWPSSINPLGSI